jgi:hypothetical protein
MNELSTQQLIEISNRLEEALSSHEYITRNSRNVGANILKEFEGQVSWKISHNRTEWFISALLNGLPKDKSAKIEKLLNSPSARFEAIFGQDRLSEVAGAWVHEYMDKFVTKLLVGGFVSDNAQATVTRDAKIRFIPADVPENGNVRKFLKHTSLEGIARDQFSKAELENADGRLDVLGVLEDENPTMAAPIIGLIKHHYFDLRPGKSLEETAELLKDRVADLPIPEDVKKGLFSKSWIATCAFSLKRRFSEDELKRDSLFPLVGAKHEDRPIAAKDISTRLGPGGLAELAREGRYPNDGAGRAREDRYVGPNAPKPQRNG